MQVAMTQQSSSAGLYGKIHPASANAAATALTPKANISSCMANPAGRAFDSRGPSSRCSSGPRSQFAQTASDIAIRTAEKKPSARASSAIGADLCRPVFGASVDGGRQCIGQVDRLRLS